jgi:sulfur carrier protein ThiS
VRITVKLFATLGEYLPTELDGHRSARHEIALDMPEGIALQAVLERFHIPREQVHLVLVNGIYVPPGRRAHHPLGEGDAVAVWPPVAGG